MQRRSKKDKIFLQLQSQLADKEAAWAKKKNQKDDDDDVMNFFLLCMYFTSF